VLAQADVKERFLAAGIEPRASTPEELGALRKSDIARVSKLIKDAGIGGK
jgi:tripartite-type tricarboxylate transporter receptor subunit TctC